MRKRIIIFNLLILTVGISFAQICKEPFLGSKTLYQPQQQIYTAVPKGYTAVFINHVGRHGARHLTKDVNLSPVFHLLNQADSGNQLTTNGSKLKEMVLILEKVEKKDNGSISQEGISELNGLGERMVLNNKTVFEKENNRLEVEFTKKIRTEQSANAFLTGLKQELKDSAVITTSINDIALRFYDFSPGYDQFKESGPWEQALSSLKKAKKYDTQVQEIASRFFQPAFFDKLSKSEKQDCVSDIFGFAAIVYSLNKEIEDAGYHAENLNFTSFFTCNELSLLAQIDNAEGFFEKGPSINVNGIQVKIAMPLLADFIKTTDDYVTTKEVNAQLRFSHAEAIAPFAALLDIITANKSTTNFKHIDKAWQASKVIPLSSNVQWILYKNEGSDDYKIKFLLNEKEAAIKGLSTKSFPYYNWNEVRAFYIKKMQHFNSGLDTDFKKYLAEAN